MKRIFIPILFAAVCSTLFAQISQKQAYNIVKSNVLKSDTTDIHLYVSKDMITPNSTVKTMYKDIISPDFTSWLFFIDDDPYQSWGHPARFVFVDMEGDIVVKSYSYPPNLENMEILIEKKYIKTDRSKLQIKSNHTVPRNTSTAQNEYAVIISGGYDRYNNYERYWNDCAAIYSTLINVYNYDRSHIYVLMSDGTSPAIDRRRLNGTYDSSPLDLDGDGTNDVRFAATRANITAVFNTLSGIMTNTDNLFIFTTDHGGVHSGQNVFMYLWNQTIEDYQLATEVNKINAKTINIVMEQCNSGGFVDNLSGNNRVVTTACRADQSSYAMPPNYDYNEFVFHWTSAVTGQTSLGATVNADGNNDGLVSAYEAFSFAKNRDTRPETPQYNSQPSNLGRELTLIGLNPTPILTGPEMIGGTTSGTYTVTNKPAYATLTWDYNENQLTLVSSSTNGIVLKPKTPTTTADTWVTATLTYPCNVQKTKTLFVGVGGPHYMNVQLIVTASSDGSQAYPSGGVCPNAFYSARLYSPTPLTNINWGASSELNVTSSSDYALYFGTGPQGWGLLNITATTIYGLTKKITGATLAGGSNCSKSSSYSKVLSVPLSGLVEVEFDMDLYDSQINKQVYTAKSSFSIRMFSTAGIQVKQETSSGETVQMDVSGLPNGIYVVHIYDGISSTPEVHKVQIAN